MARNSILVCLSLPLAAGFLLNSKPTNSINASNLMNLTNSTALTDLINLPDSTNSSDSLNLVKGEKLYKSKCGKCHALWNPKDYKLKTWKRNLDEMKEKAELNAEEFDLIFAYLRANCKK